MTDELEAWLTGLQSRARLHGALRGLAAGAGSSAVLVGIGAPPAVALLAVAGAAFGLLRAPGPAALAARADQIGGLNDALACAWDHRTGAAPILVAQRRAALRAGQGVPRTELLPRPSVLWGLGPLLWAWPLLSPPAATWREALGAAAGDASDPAAEAARMAARGAAPPAHAAPTGASGEGLSAGRAGPSAPAGEEEPGEGQGQGTPSAEASAQAPGVGARAGELSGGRIRPVAAAASEPGAGRALTLSRGAGESAAGTHPQAAAALGAPPSTRDDALADPARPYAPADAPLIAAYFDARARRPSSPPAKAP